jgi:hypothetical protein
MTRRASTGHGACGRGRRRFKGEGFDLKILKEIIKLRKQDQEVRDERESLLDLYMRAMEQAGPEKVAKAA